MYVALICLSLWMTQVNSLVEIPSHCYDPPGQTCQWYPECLEKRHPCPKQNYAMKYAHHFCSKFGDQYKKFTSRGKQWIDGTRKCLQRVLVPFLNRSKIECDDLKKEAFDSHTCCYLADPQCTPDDEKATSISICNVPFQDWLRVFWITKGAFNVFGQNSEVTGSLKLILKVLHGCTFGQLGDEVVGSKDEKFLKNILLKVKGVRFDDRR